MLRFAKDLLPSGKSSLSSVRYAVAAGEKPSNGRVILLNARLPRPKQGFRLELTL
jgi:hypothetical protein